MYATAAAAAGANLPADRIIDGVDLTPHVLGTATAEVPHEYLFFRSGAAQAVRDQRWKLMVSAPQGLPRKEWLFDLTADGEWTDLLAQHRILLIDCGGSWMNNNSQQAVQLALDQRNGDKCGSGFVATRPTR